MSKRQLSYKQLKKIWYKKLADSGFQDIECKNAGFKGGSLKSKFTREKHTRYSFEAKQQYTYAAERFLNTHEFDSTLEKTIWMYHVEGITNPDILKILKGLKTKLTFKTRQSVWLIIKKYKDLMKKGL